MQRILTTNGLISQPHMVSRFNHTRLMVAKAQFTPRAVLRRNLKALMDKAKKDEQPDLYRQIRLGKRARVAQATIGRILSAEGEDSSIETVAKLASAFGLEAWQLMVAGMDPSNPPVLQPVSKEEQELYRRLKELAKDLR
jgi:transcriptional regulator with XRE-family HTH domain